MVTAVDPRVAGLSRQLPKYTWAQANAAGMVAALSGQDIRITDIGPQGSTWYSNGTVWKPIGGGAIPYMANPLWVECIADFGRCGSGTPGGLTNYADGTTHAGYAVNTARVSGGRGETTLTLDTGTVADLSGTWAAVILHDNGSYGTYTVRNATGAALDVFPPLRANCNRALITNLHNSASGQHYTKHGYRALADHVFDYPTLRAMRQTFVAQWLETAASGWTLVGGQSSGRVSYNNAKNLITAAAVLSSDITKRNTKGVCVTPGGANQGVSYTFTLGGASGYIDTYVGSLSATLPVLATVTIDGNLVYNEQVYGLERIVIPFNAASSAVIQFTMSALSNDGFYVGTTTAWKRPAAGYSERVIPDGARVVMLGDSWSVFYNAAFVERLNERLAPSGGEAITVGVAGETSTWGLANFTSLVTPKAPTHVVLEFFTNDNNQGMTAAQLKTNLLALADMCYAIGAQPIILMPCATGSSSQTQQHAILATGLAEGVAA